MRAGAVKARAENGAALLREATGPIKSSGVDARGYPWRESYAPPSAVEGLVGMAEELDRKGLHRAAARLRERVVLNGFAGLSLKCRRKEAREFFRVVLALDFKPEHRAAFWHVVTRSETWREKPTAEMFDALRAKVLNAVGKADAVKSRRREVRYAESLDYRPWRSDPEIEPVKGEPVEDKEKEPPDLTALAVKAAKAGHLTLKQAALISRVRGVRGVGVKEARKALKYSPGVEQRLVENLRKVGNVKRLS